MKRKYELVPAIDIMAGNLVRLCRGKFGEKTVYSEFPLSVAKNFEDLGFKRLHVVDLDGAREGVRANFEVIKEISQKTNLKVDVGGGIRSLRDVQRYLDTGVQMVTVSTMAVINKPEFIRCLQTYQPENFILGADVLDGMIVWNGWRETSKMDLLSFILEYLEFGVDQILCTDIQKDGMLTGPSFELYEQILKRLPMIRLISSGGVSDLSDVRRLLDIGAEEVIIGKSIYEKTINLGDLADLQNRGVIHAG